jgi:hypothetical protein
MWHALGLRRITYNQSLEPRLTVLCLGNRLSVIRFQLSGRGFAASSEEKTGVRPFY